VKKDAIGANSGQTSRCSKVQSVTAKSAVNAIEKSQIKHQYDLIIRPRSSTDRSTWKSIDCVRSCRTTRLLSNQKACECSKLLELAVENLHGTTHVVSLSRLFSKPVAHFEELSVPVFGVFASREDSGQDQWVHYGCKNVMGSDQKSVTDDTNGLSAPEPFNQRELNHFVRDLGLSKKAAEILASRLQENHLLDSANVPYTFHIFERDLSFQNRSSLFTVTVFLICSGS